MKHFSMPLSLALAALSLLFSVIPATAGNRPMKSSGEGEVSNDFLQASGTATHFGRMELEVSVHQDSLQRLGIFFPSGGGWLTTASGDSLYFVFNEEFCFVDSSGTVNTTLTILGGTGRFQNAIADVNVVLVFDSNRSHFLFLFDGRIDY